MGQCAEFCGLQHAHMALSVVVEPQPRFAAWLEAQRLPAAATPGTAQQQRGQEVFVTASCVLCHSVRGTPAGGRQGPDLTHLASRRTIAAGILPNDATHLRRWVVDAQGPKPGSNMPPNQLAEADLQALLAYLQGLR